MSSIFERPLPACPHCEAALVPETIEIDVEVWVQTRTVGFRCPNDCPFGFGVCGGCGTIEAPGRRHYLWCSYKPGVLVPEVVLGVASENAPKKTGK